MPITELLERNAKEFADDVALVEINPEIQEKKRVTWREYEFSRICVSNIEEKLHGMYLTKRQTELPIC